MTTFLIWQERKRKREIREVKASKRRDSHRSRRARWAASAERKGWAIGMAVEAALLGGGIPLDDGTLPYAGSWYQGALLEFGEDEALIGFAPPARSAKAAEEWGGGEAWPAPIRAAAAELLAARAEAECQSEEEEEPSSDEADEAEGSGGMRVQREQATAVAAEAADSAE